MAIRVLGREVASKIAAGEVIERPSLAVKELIENSLDAGSRRIIVEITRGGLDLIRVTDNGSGIVSDELETAFERHATSKISHITDLDRIVTLGFRGEALPSIAAISKLKISTCVEGSYVGREVELLWGTVTKNVATGRPQGTSISVQDIFSNFPGRRKFLKSPLGEAARISRAVSRFVLAFPRVEFQLIIDGRTVTHSPGNGNLREAVSAVYGSQMDDSLLEVCWETEESDYRVSGLISVPSLNRANRNYVTLMVNNRWVQSPLLLHAISESYKDYVPDRRHPIAILNINVPTEDVDVNVHPTKREVRFREDDRVFSIFRRAVKSSLTDVSHISQMDVQSVRSGLDTTQGHDINLNKPSMFERDVGIANYSHGSVVKDDYSKSYVQTKIFPSLDILGQIRNTYIVSEGVDGLFLMDQHAAHERVVFERLLSESTAKTVDVQALLEPMVLDPNPDQENTIRTNTDMLARYGFNIEEFGDRTYIIRSVPSIVGNNDPLKAIVDMLDIIGKDHLLREKEEAMVASISCHGSIRAGKRLTQEEMSELARLLGYCRNPYHCPHGRPTIIHISPSQLEKEFGRR